jgi:hypothetical protein
MPGPPLAQHVAIDSLAIVADSDRQYVIAVADFRFALGCLGVGVGVSQRLTRDQLDLFATDRIELADRALDRDSKWRRVCRRRSWTIRARARGCVGAVPKGARGAFTRARPSSRT